MIHPLRTRKIAWFLWETVSRKDECSGWSPSSNHLLPSNNLAKTSLEFSFSIDRADLKVVYGEGFGGAPLQTNTALHLNERTGTGENRYEQAKVQSSKRGWR